MAVGRKRNGSEKEILKGKKLAGFECKQGVGEERYGGFKDYVDDNESHFKQVDRQSFNVSAIKRGPQGWCGLGQDSLL